MRQTKMKLVLTLGLCVALFAMCGLLQALEVPLEYVRYSDDHEGFSVSGYANVEMAKDPPEGNWKLPKLGKHPLYGQVLLGDRQHLVVLDDRKRGSERYDRMYFDLNANGDLTDDQVINGKSERRKGEDYWNVSFPATDLTIEVEGKDMPFRFSGGIWCHMNKPNKPVTHEENMMNFNFSLRSRCAYKGSFEVTGTTYRFVLSDSNSNGRFRDGFKLSEKWQGQERLYASGDRIYLTAKKSLDHYCGQVLGDYLVAGKTLYSVAVDTVSRTMTLTPVTDDVALLELPYELDRLSVTSTDGSRHVMMVKPAQAAPVPAGEYRLYDYLLHRADSQGGLWRLGASATHASPKINAVAGATAQMAMGEPFTPVVDVDYYSRERFMEGHSKEVRLAFNAVGQAQETISDLTRVKGTKSKTKIKMAGRHNSSRPVEPTYKVIKSDGEMVTQGSFEYG